MFRAFVLAVFMCLAGTTAAWDDGWLRYAPLANLQRAQYASNFSAICVTQQQQQQQPLSLVLNNTAAELSRGLKGLLALALPPPVRLAADCAASSAGGEIILTSAGRAADSKASEGYTAKSASCGGSSSSSACTCISAASDTGVLYGAFALLRRLQTVAATAEPMAPASAMPDVTEAPASALRLWDLWDNLDGSVERGYAGRSIFDWSALPAIVSPRYSDYARLLASTGVNGAAFVNVNACKDGNSKLLGSDSLAKLAVVARIFAGWGVSCYLTPCFASPMDVGGLKTADPLDASVQAWWRATAATLRAIIPSFRGWLIKADSEGEPGPSTYHRNQSQGANMLATALAPVNGTLLWRAFEYGGGGDRATRAYDTFAPYDGEFLDNVVLQIKNGPLDFQVREPASALFGAGLRAASGEPLRLLLELQATQEYLGQAKALALLAPQWEYYLGFPLGFDAKTGAGGALRDVVTDVATGAGMAAVSNFGSDPSWAGITPMANAYAFGRMAWDPHALPAAAVLHEWVAQTWGGADATVLHEIADMGQQSWRVFENYTSPLGVGFCEGSDHQHADPNQRNSDYLHADGSGIGYDRTAATGSGYIAQYPSSVAALFEELSVCPQEQLLFMHHVPWDHTLNSSSSSGGGGGGGGSDGGSSGMSLIQYLYASHGNGVAAVASFGARWAALAGRPGMDTTRHASVMAMLGGQLEDAKKWCSTMAKFFEDKSGIKPAHGSADALCNPPAPPAPPTPPPSPTPAPPPGSFTEHVGAYCAITGTSARRVYDKKGRTLAECEGACAADAACTCFDFDTGDGGECRYIEGQGKVTKSSSKDRDAYVRDSHDYAYAYA